MKKIGHKAKPASAKTGQTEIKTVAQKAEEIEKQVKTIEPEPVGQEITPETKHAEHEENKKPETKPTDSEIKAKHESNNVKEHEEKIDVQPEHAHHEANTGHQETHHTEHKNMIEKTEIKNRKKIVIIMACIAFALIALIPSGYFYSKYRQSQRLIQNPTLAATEETNKLIGRVGKLIKLSEGEIPTVATISDKEKLKNQAFFAQAKNGDKVLIYTQARKAILYDPVTNLIIDVAPVNMGSPSASAQTTVSPTPAPVTAILLNGTNVTGLTLTAEKTLKERAPNVTVKDRDNAKKRDYTDNLVIDVKGSYPNETKSIASVLAGKVAALPEGETAPEGADILIILGGK